MSCGRRPGCTLKHTARQGREAGTEAQAGEAQVGGRSAAPEPWGPPCLHGLALPAAFAFPANVRLQGPAVGPRQEVPWPMTHTCIQLVRCRDNSVLPHLWLATALMNSHGLEDQNRCHQWMTGSGPVLGSSHVFSLLHMDIS